MKEHKCTFDHGGECYTLITRGIHVLKPLHGIEFRLNIVHSQCLVTDYILWQHITSLVEGHKKT